MRSGARLVGAMFWGVMSDKLGRRPAFFMTSLVASCSGLLTEGCPCDPGAGVGTGEPNCGGDVGRGEPSPLARRQSFGPIRACVLLRQGTTLTAAA
jgi:hypothetical protein